MCTSRLLALLLDSFRLIHVLHIDSLTAIVFIMIIMGMAIMCSLLLLYSILTVASSRVAMASVGFAWPSSTWATWHACSSVATHSTKKHACDRGWSATASVRCAASHSAERGHPAMRGRGTESESMSNVRGMHASYTRHGSA